MNQKIYLSESNSVILACSVCNRQKIVDMTPYLAKENLSKIKVKCRCGHCWTLDLEKTAVCPKINQYTR